MQFDVLEGEVVALDPFGRSSYGQTQIQHQVTKIIRDEQWRRALEANKENFENWDPRRKVPKGNSSNEGVMVVDDDNFTAPSLQRLDSLAPDIRPGESPIELQERTPAHELMPGESQSTEQKNDEQVGVRMTANVQRQKEPSEEDVEIRKVILAKRMGQILRFGNQDERLMDEYVQGRSEARSKEELWPEGRKRKPEEDVPIRGKKKKPGVRYASLPSTSERIYYFDQIKVSAAMERDDDEGHLLESFRYENEPIEDMFNRKKADQSLILIALEMDPRSYRHVFFRIEASEKEKLDQTSYLMSCLYRLKDRMVGRGMKEVAVRAHNRCFKEVNWETLYTLLDGVFRKTNIRIYALLNYEESDSEEELEPDTTMDEEDGGVSPTYPPAKQNHSC